MSNKTTHPSNEQLNAYNLGQLPADEAVAIESHISTCDTCCETIVGLTSDDTFVGLLKEARQVPTDQTTAYGDALANEPAILLDIPAPLAQHPRYEVLHLVGKGGMGDVYKARHRKMERAVALKVINRALVQKYEAVERFHREVKAAARLSHPNIVTAYDADQVDDFHFMVMEYVDGVDLSQTVKDQGALPIVEACEFVRQAATGLQHAHEQGMVHRDIKPHNLMVTADGTVKILDFGLAALASQEPLASGTAEVRSDLTAVGATMGTPDFISPEQANDARQADIRSDIYSLGGTLYYLLCGRTPFVEGSVMHKLKSHAELEPEPLESVRQDIPAELTKLVSKMLAKDPNQRFQTPAEVADALASFVSATTIGPEVAKQDPPRGFFAEHRNAFFIGASVCLLGVAMAVAYLPSLINGKTQVSETASTAAFTNGQGKETAGAKAAITLPPEQIVAAANSKFACGLYSQLAETNAGENLLFSPYSISNALFMVAEGARGETALEMGKVLGFPEALLRTRQDAQLLPLEVSMIRAGQSRMNRLVGGKDVESSEQQKLRSLEAQFLNDWQQLKKRRSQVKSGDTNTLVKIVGEEQKLVSRLNAVRKKLDTITLKIANAVWGDRTLEILDPWREAATESFGAGAVQDADFLYQSKLERERINAWVSEETEGKIEDLFSASDISKETRLVLASAIYFRGDWMTPFLEAGTKKLPFQLASGTETPVEMMQKNRDETASYAAFNGDGTFFETPEMVPMIGGGPAKYSGKDGFAMVELPYQGGDVSMVVIAPNDPAGLGALEKRISATNLKQWIAALKHRKTNIALPKFKLESSFSLKQTLKAMGMSSTFDSKTSDFSGISEAEQVLIGAVLHRGAIEVNEKGAEVAAATGIGGSRGMGVDSAEELFIPSFEADRPFVFLIRDVKSGAILFLGRVMNPNT